MEKIEHRRRSSTIEVVGSDIGDQERILSEEEAHFLEQLRVKDEREKTHEELELIHEISRRLREFIGERGGQYIEIPVNNIHFFTWEDMDPETKSRILSERPDFTGFEGKFSHKDQNVYIIHNKQTEKLQFAKTLAHELIHLMAFNSLAIIKKEGKNLTISDRRLGFAVNIKNRVFYFNDINEALTRELDLKFRNKYFDEINFTAELENERRRLVQGFKSDPDIPDNEKIEIEDSVWIKLLDNGRYRYMADSYEKEKKIYEI